MNKNHSIFVHILLPNTSKMKKLLTAAALFSAGATLTAQNIGINTDGTSPETGVMLDVKGTSPVATTAALQNLFQVKSFDADAAALKLRLGLKTDATAGLRYGLIDVYDAGAAAYRHLTLQPLGGNVGIGTIAPASVLSVVGTAASSSVHSSFGSTQWRMKLNGTDEVNSATIDYRGFDATALGIVGAGTAGTNRLIRMWEFLGINTAPSTNQALNVSGTNATYAAVFQNGSVGIGTTTPRTTLDVNGSVAFRDGGALALAVGVNNNITLPGTTPYSSFYRITVAGAFTIAGITPPASVDGMILTLYNTTAFAMTVANNAGTSAAGSRIITTTGANITSNVGSNVLQLQYNTTLASWIVLNSAGFDNNWRILGNAGTVDGTHFLGTTDDIPFNIRVNNQRAGRIDNATGATYNVALGYLALSQATRGTKNVAIGYEALLSNTSGAGGIDNVAVGYQALRANNIASGCFGGSALSNTAVGAYALTANTCGYDNTAVGAGALKANTDSWYNTAVGMASMEKNTTGSSNTGIGFLAMGNNTTGFENTALGSSALSGNTTGAYNVAVGVGALSAVTTGSNNVGIGGSALQLTTTGTGNIAIGPVRYRGNPFFDWTGAGRTNTVGTNNIFIGYLSNVGSNNLTNAIAIGALSYVTASNSMVLGAINGTNGATASTNVGIGITAPLSILDVYGIQSSASANMSISRVNGQLTGTGDGPAGYSVWTTLAPTANLTLAYGSVTVGNSNLAVGRAVTDYNIGHFRFDSQVGSSGTITNVNVIQAATPSMAGIKPTTIAGLRVKNQGVATVGTAYGIFVETQSAAGANYAAVFQGGNVGIGNTAPAEPLEVTGVIRATGFRCRAGTAGATSNVFNINWTGAQADLWIDGVNVVSGILSDRRLKENIDPIDNNAISRLMELHPVSFKYKKVNETFTGSPTVYEGFIADELQSVIPSAVNGEKNALTREGNIQPQTLNLAPLVSVLTKAMQEQQLMIEKLKSDNEILKANSEARIEKLESEMNFLLQASKAEAKK